MDEPKYHIGDLVHLSYDHRTFPRIAQITDIFFKKEFEVCKYKCRWLHDWSVMTGWVTESDIIPVSTPRHDSEEDKSR